MCVIVLVEFCKFCLKLVILEADVFSSEIGMFQLNEWHCFVSNSGQKKSTKNLEKMDFKKEAITCVCFLTIAKQIQLFEFPIYK